MATDWKLNSDQLPNAQITCHLPRNRFLVQNLTLVQQTWYFKPTHFTPTWSYEYAIFQLSSDGSQVQLSKTGTLVPEKPANNNNNNAYYQANNFVEVIAFPHSSDHDVILARDNSRVYLFDLTDGSASQFAIAGRNAWPLLHDRFAVSTHDSLSILDASDIKNVKFWKGIGKEPSSVKLPHGAGDVSSLVATPDGGFAILTTVPKTTTQQTSGFGQQYNPQQRVLVFYNEDYVPSSVIPVIGSGSMVVLQDFN